MDVAKRKAQEVARPDRRAAATLQDAVSRSSRGASTAIQNPRGDGVIWWRIGDPTITLSDQPRPFPG